MALSRKTLKNSMFSFEIPEEMDKNLGKKNFMKLKKNSFHEEYD